MTHIESHDLLLDLAYGELPAHVAAEVSQHLEGCAECQAESAQLDGVRKAFAPIGESEEPSAGFDDRVLAAARAEALLEHDGNIGQVIEGAGSFAAPSLSAASVDAHAAPVAAVPARRRPKWMTRVLLGSSAAAAAALALAVGVSQPTHREPRRSEEYAIRVAPPVAPPAAAPNAAPAPAAPVQAAPVQAPPEDAKMATQDSEALNKALPATSSAPAESLQRMKGAQLHAQRAEPKKKSSQRAGSEGSGGDVPSQQALALRDSREAAGAGAVSAAAPPAAEKEVAMDAQNVVVTGSSVRRREATKDESADVPASAASQPGDAANDALASDARAPASPAKMATASRVSKAAVPTPEDPADLEHRAEAARHEGNYGLAAGLYREAATGHNYNSGAAAWDLAHAVECLAAAGSFEEARKVRDQLGKLFPTEINAFAAARRALREVDATPSK